MFLISSNTIEVKRNDNSTVKTISSIGALITHNGRKYHRIPAAISSGVVVHKVR